MLTLGLLSAPDMVKEPLLVSVALSLTFSSDSFTTVIFFFFLAMSGFEYKSSALEEGCDFVAVEAPPADLAPLATFLVPLLVLEDEEFRGTSTSMARSEWPARLVW